LSFVKTSGQAASAELLQSRKKTKIADIGIRPATASDIDNIALLAQVVWVTTYAKEGISTAFSRYVSGAFSCDTLLHEFKNNHLIVAEREQCLLGYALLEQNTAELKTLYVLPQLKGQGVGTALVRYCQQISVKPLWLTCWEGNTGALAFYQKLQFSVAGEVDFILETQRYRNIRLTL
jgi:ribosomal protein S18 acetylase RimI-like enzyme